MSGHKVSVYTLNLEREKLERLRNDVNRKTKEVCVLKRMVEELRNDIDQDERPIRPELLADINAWLTNTASAAATPIPQAETSSATWSRRSEELNRHIEAGKRIQELLIAAHESQAFRIEQRRKLADVDLLFQSSRDQLIRWFGDRKVDEVETERRRIGSDIDGDARDGLEENIEAYRASLMDAVDQANARELSHQKRMYLLECLRQLCERMDFNEISCKMPADLNDRIVLSVDTHAYGIMTFYLALSDVSVDSPITRDRCSTDFRDISERLMRYYGIHTEFRLADEDPDEENLTFDALEEPDDLYEEAED
jgi:hypothetical protein